jgi:hypothetical protein
MRTKKKLKHGQNRTVLQLKKLLLLQIRFAKNRRKLNVLYGQLSVIILPLRRRSNTLSMFKPEKSSKQPKKQPKLCIKLESHLQRSPKGPKAYHKVKGTCSGGIK